MGVPVTLDSDDVECLLMAAALTKEFDSRLRSMSDDAQMRRVKHKIESAFDRINALRGAAIRMEEPFDSADLSESEISYLDKLANRVDVYEEINKANFAMVNSLRRHKLVVAGTLNNLIVWGNKTEQTIAGQKQVVKITERGQIALAQRKQALSNQSPVVVGFQPVTLEKE